MATKKKTAQQKTPWSEFLSLIRAANPDLTPEVEKIFTNIEDARPWIYWCPNTGKKYEPLIFDVPVPANPLAGRLCRITGAGALAGDILVWVNDSITQEWIELDRVEVDLRLAANVVARVRMELLQRLQQPIEDQQGRKELRDFGVFKAHITNPQTRAPGGDTYILFFSMVKSQAMVKQVFAKHRLHIHVAALVESDLREAGESAEGNFKLLQEHERLIGNWRFLIARRETRLDGWHLTDIGGRDGWGEDELWMWSRGGGHFQQGNQRVAPAQVPVVPDNAWACAMLRAVNNPAANVYFTISVEGLGSMRLPCSRYLHPLISEENVIRQYLEPFQKKAYFYVLDIGCGVGRHLGFIRDTFSSARFYATESDAALRKHCADTYCAGIHNSKMFPRQEDVMPPHSNEKVPSILDAVLLLGNGIGLYGQPGRLADGLKHIFELLRPGGVLIGECGALPGTPPGGFSEKKVTINFEEAKPSEFPWLFCTWEWLRPKLEAAGFEIDHEKDIGNDEPGGFLFVARKPLYPQKYYESVLQQLLPEDRAAHAPVSTLEEVLRDAQARGGDLPGGDTPDAIVRRDTASNGVFFYPACGVDWNPLHRFSGRCDTFVYCDYGFILETVVANIRAQRRYLTVNAAVLIPQEFVRAMTRDSLMPNDWQNRVSMVEPWGCLFTLTCNATNPPKKLHLIYLAVEGVTLYANLFGRMAHPHSNMVWAPEFLCIKRDGMGFGNGWADFRDWARPLGNEVMRNQKKPKYVVCAGDNWPWDQRWLHFHVWGGERYVNGVVVSHRPEVMPTKREGEDFCLPGIPQEEWPEITPQPPRPTVPQPLEAAAEQPPGDGAPNQDLGNNPPDEGLTPEEIEEIRNDILDAVADFGVLHNELVEKLPHDIYRDFELSEDEPGVFRISMRVAAPVVSLLDKQRIAEDLKTRLSQIVQQISDQPSPEQWHRFHGVQFNEISFSSWWVTVKMTVEFVNNG